MSDEKQQQPQQLTVYERPPANPRAAISTLKELLAKRQGDIAKVAAAHLNPERLTRIAISAVSRDQYLLECTPISVLKSIMQAVSLGLEPGGPLGDAYLVGYYNKKALNGRGARECQLIPGYRGLVSLARRSGQILSIEANVVYAKDTWEYEVTDERTRLRHVPTEDDQPGEVLRFYAIARLKDTPLPVIIVMPKRAVDRIMRGTQSEGKYGPWKDHYEEMGKKTAIRRIVKSLPMSVEFADALSREDRVEAGEAPDDVIDVSFASSAEDDAPPEQAAVAVAPPPAELPAAQPPVKTESRPKAAAEPQAAPAAKAAPKAPKAASHVAETCRACDAVLPKHFSGCPNSPEVIAAEQRKRESEAAAFGDQGDEIQGREREVGEDG